MALPSTNNSLLAVGLTEPQLLEWSESESVSDLVFVSPAVDVSGDACWCRQHTDDMDDVEHMLRNRHIYAIGRVVRPQDFKDYMRFRDRIVFLSQYQPEVICCAVRQASDHAPEGVLSIGEHLSHVSIAVPACTFVATSLS